MTQLDSTQLETRIEIRKAARFQHCILLSITNFILIKSAVNLERVSCALIPKKIIKSEQRKDGFYRQLPSQKVRTSGLELLSW